MPAARVGKALSPVPRHFLDHGRMGLGGGVVVEIDRGHVGKCKNRTTNDEAKTNSKIKDSSWERYFLASVSPSTFVVWHSDLSSSSILAARESAWQP
jgi:hypothetical protein